MTVSRIGRYEILETLGRGAMGVVYLARDPLIDREVALKTLRVDLADEMADEFRTRFLREARAAGRLSHPGIVTIHDVGEDTASGVVFIAMELIRGRDLKQLLADGARFHPAEAARIAADVALALDYAHSMGVVHRDIKPANIILTQDGTAKITDFGVARLESSNLTVEGQFIGTPNYMSPEQITGRLVDGRSDIFSLGVVLYALLTGARPFAGETMHEVTRHIVDEPCPIPSTVSSGLSPAFNPVVLRCLEKDPERRFQTAGQVGRVLDALARSLAAAGAAKKGSRTLAARPELATREMMAERVRQSAGADPTEQPESVTGAAPRGTLTAVLRRLRRLDVRRLPLPAFMHWEVNPRWAMAIAGGWLLVCAAVVLALAAAREEGPFPAPDDRTVANLHRTARRLQEARHQLAAGDLARSQASLASVLDQAPASTAARRLALELKRRTDAARQGSETAERVAGLVREGRQLFREERYDEAAERFAAALDLDEDSELAASYLDLTLERSQARATRPTPAPARRQQARQQRASPERSTPVAPTGRARLTVFFRSPLSTGSVVVSVEGASRHEIPFDFSERTLFGLRTRKGTGTVKDVFTLPAGERVVTAQVVGAERGLLGTATFRRTLRPGSDWTLRIDMADVDSRPGFVLVQPSR